MKKTNDKFPSTLTNRLIYQNQWRTTECMPLPLPKLSGVHRAAGIALYRALLSKCRGQREASVLLQNIVRNRFQVNRDLESPRLLDSAFRIGYEALNILTASAQGDAWSQTQIRDCLPRISEHFKRPRPLLRFSISVPRIIPRFGTSKPTHSMLERPFPEVSGVRHVPVWTRAHSAIPFLRVTKPQPKILSRTIAGKIKRRIRWQVVRDDIAQSMATAHHEDNWEDLLAEEFGSRDDAGRTLERKSSWSLELKRNIGELNFKLSADFDASIRLSKQMEQVMHEERELANEERKKANKQKRWKRLSRRMAEARKARRANQHQDSQ